MKRVIIGVLIWIFLLGWAICSVWQPSEDSASSKQLSQYLFGRRQQVELRFYPGQVFQVGDPIFLNDSSEIRKPIGIITRVNEPDSNEMGIVHSTTAFATFYPNAPDISVNDFVQYHSNPDSMSWVVETMLPPERRKEIAQLLLNAYQANQDEINEALKPIIQQTIEDSATVIAQDLQASLKARSSQLEKIGNRLQVDLVQEDLLPLLQEHIWPVIQEEVTPVINDVGKEIWSEASLFRFGWRYLYDASPLPKKDLMKKEFDRFVKDSALPIVEDHLDEFMDAQRKIMRRVSKNEKVQQVVSNSVKEVVNDPEIQMVFGQVFNEVLVSNPRLQEVWQRNWNTEQAKRALNLTNSKLEPTITEIGEILFGNPNKQITPEFSIVLRNRVLFKDDRWLTLVHDPDAELESGNLSLDVLQGELEKGELPPFHVPARPRQ